MYVELTEKGHFFCLKILRQVYLIYQGTFSKLNMKVLEISVN
jgi:hypothetical protein